MIRIPHPQHKVAVAAADVSVYALLYFPEYLKKKQNGG